METGGELRVEMLYYICVMDFTLLKTIRIPLIFINFATLTKNVYWYETFIYSWSLRD